MDSQAPIADLPAAVRWRAYLISVLGWMFDFYDLVVFAYLARAIGRDWHWGADFNRNKALLVGITLAASGIGGIVFGGLADRFGRRSVMAWTILIYSVSTGLCGLAPSIVWLACLRAVHQGKTIISSGIAAKLAGHMSPST